MKRDGKYRFSLQFGSSSAEELRVGELLERLGNKKSRIIVCALNEYADHHPEIEAGSVELKVSRQSVSMEMIEQRIREMIAQHLGGAVKETVLENPVSSEQSIDKDIMDMLSDLELFG